jgi:hypothetical protein
MGFSKPHRFVCNLHAKVVRIFNLLKINLENQFGKP